MAALGSPFRLLAFLALLLLAASAPAPTAAARSSKPKKPSFPRITPLQLQALRHQRPRASSSGSRYVAAVTNDTAGMPFTAHYFPQELDHFTFTPNASAVFYQKYLVNDTFWKRSTGHGNGSETAAGPIFVYTGNEGDIEWFTTNTGFMFDIAPKFGALLVSEPPPPSSIRWPSLPRCAWSSATVSHESEPPAGRVACGSPRDTEGQRAAAGHCVVPRQDGIRLLPGREENMGEEIGI